MDNNKERIDLIKEVYSKTGYPRIIDTNFNQLGNISVNEQLDTEVSVEEFFNLYTKLFYEIPSFGGVTSHEYLITTSTEYIDFKPDNEIIEALQKEIAQLRRELLQSQIDKTEALTGTDLGINLDEIENESLQGKALAEIQSQIDQSGANSQTNN
tara:strand:- start:552 stop:1016 length:465 start_codon:yes stop_codon:yes gene_type:complete